MYIIGIAGGTGSGKTTVVKKIMKALEGENVAVIPQDSYYNDNTHLTMEERRKINGLRLQLAQIQKNVSAI